MIRDFRRFLVPGVLVACFAPCHAAAPATTRPGALLIEPSRVVLTHRDDLQHLLVSQSQPDGSVRDLTRIVRYQPATSGIVAISPDGVVRPSATGTTILTVQHGALTARITIEVRGIQPRPVSFAGDVMHVLARAGCNSGACHGSASGKKGFKVSLRGYDPAADFLTLTRGSTGRRIDRLDPGTSLLVLKPTGQAIHEGGKRFDTGSPFAEVLTRWIAEGARSDLATAPIPQRLEVHPATRSFAGSGQTQQLVVRCHLSDGSVRDVTDLARFSSSNDAAATVNDSGLVTLGDPGEAAVMVRFGPLVAVSNLVLLRQRPGFRWSDPPVASEIDRHVFAKLRTMQVLPSDLTTDVEFLRRVSYDLTGLPPTPQEVRAFVNDQRSDKRARKVDELFDRPAHAEFWAGKWADLLRLRFDLTGDKTTWSAYRWLRDSIAANRPFDQFVRDILTAEGSTEANAPASYWQVFNTTEDAVEATAQIFLGIRLMCARCHDHPFEKWVQSDYYGFAAFFSQVGRKPGNRTREQIIFRQTAAARSRHPISGKMLDPKFLDGAEVKVDDRQDGRRILADWMTRKDNPFLARATVNRIWSHLFGRGIIDPVDDIRSSNPPVNEALLDYLTRDFVAHGFDVRHTIRQIVLSRTYQLSARTNRFNADDRVNFSRAMPRRLSAEQLLDTIVAVTGIQESFRARIRGQQSVAIPAGGIRAAQLPDRSMTSEMLDLFGRPRGDSSCTCERSDESSLTHALHLIGGKAVNTRLASPASAINRLASVAATTNDKLIEELFLLVLARFPTPREQELLRGHLASAKDRKQAAQDVAWALLNSREFLFNH